MGSWVLKSKTPSERPDESADTTGEDLWWTDKNNLPQADTEWILDPEIPENYIPVPGEDELYMVIDEEGNIKQYRHREKQDDGSWLWETVNPDIPDNYEAVEGLENVYMVTNKDGTISYFKYIRNEDDTFAFVPVNEKGEPLEDDTPKGSEIPENYRHIQGNIYAVYNENNVIIGYKERSVDKDGNYVWKDCEKPVVNDKPDNGGDTSHGSTAKDPIFNTSSDETDISQSQNSSGEGYTETETIRHTEISGGWKITYETKVTRVYDSNGELLSTKKEGPYEISKEKINGTDSNAPDKSLIKGTLQEEFARVNIGLLYKNELSEEILVEINAERIAAGVGPLSINDSSKTTLISKIRAADMARYNHSDFDSPMYGTVANMCNRFNITDLQPSEVVWKTASDKSASAIASRIKIMCGDAITDARYTDIGISIVSKNGYYYVNVILT